MRSKLTLLLLSASFCVFAAPTRVLGQDTAIAIHLWEGGAPGFEDRKDEPEVAKDWWIKNIHNPSITVYRPAAEIATDVGVVVFPGGGFRELVFNPEGRDAGAYLGRMGVTVFAVKYRLANEEGSPYSVDVHARQDANRAMRVARSHAAEFGVDPNKLGAMGFSAGGYMVSMVAYGPNGGDPNAADPVERLSAKPDFQILVYPGPGSLPEVIPQNAPPAFVLAAIDDECCGAAAVEVLKRYFDAGLPIEGHIYAQGGHAFNMGNRSELRTISRWPERLEDWLYDNIVVQAND